MSNQNPPNYDVFTPAGIDKQRKTSALDEVTNYLRDEFESQSVTWDALDSLSKQTILENAIQCMHAGKLEYAALGIVYLLFQERIFQTNKAQAKIGGLA